MKKKTLAIFTILIIAAFAVPAVPSYAAGTTTLGGAEIPDRFSESFDVENCLDISSWNGEITDEEWQTLKEQGVSSVIIRAGYSGWYTGFHHKDSTFEDNMEGAHKAGMEIGSYYYTTALSDEEAASEAEYFVELLEPYKEYLTLPAAYDFETNEHGRLDGAAFSELGMDGCTSLCTSFCDVIENSGLEPMIYANRATFNRYLDTDVVEGRYRLWLAQFTNDGSATGYEGSYDMWQYSSSVTISGVNSRFDANYLFKRKAGREDKEIAETSGNKGASESSFTLSEGVHSVVPVSSKGKTANARVTDDFHLTHQYRIFKTSDKHPAEECLMACLLNGYFVSDNPIDPEYVSSQVAPTILGKDYSSLKDNGKIMSMSGMYKIVSALGLDAEYVKDVDDQVYVKIKGHLASGKPVILSLNKSSRWSDGNETVLLLGMDENGYGIMADSEDRYWSDNDQRVKLVSIDELIDSMISSDNGDDTMVDQESQQSGYILINSD